MDTYSITPSYLRNPHSEAGSVTDYRDWQIPLGRRFRSLKVWFVLRSYGVNGLRAFIRRHVELGVYFHSLLLSKPEIFSITTEPAFGLVTFQVLPSIKAKDSTAKEPDPRHEAYTADFTPDADAMYQEMCNQRTKEVYEAINAKGEFFLTSTVLGGKYVIRVVSATLLSEQKYMKELCDALVVVAEGV